MSCSPARLLSLQVLRMCTSFLPHAEDYSEDIGRSYWLCAIDTNYLLICLIGPDKVNYQFGRKASIEIGYWFPQTLQFTEKSADTRTSIKRGREVSQRTQLLTSTYLGRVMDQQGFLSISRKRRHVPSSCKMPPKKSHDER
jgi:hypothetical protein